MRAVVDAVVARAAERWGAAGRARRTSSGGTRPTTSSPFSRAADGRRRRPCGSHGRLAEAGVTDGLAIASRKPEWMRAKAAHRRRLPSASSTRCATSTLVTVCEEAGCPNIFECWADGTATFMINGERCTRACGFCLVDTRHPAPLERTSRRGWPRPSSGWGSRYAVITAVARDDLADGGAAAFAADDRRDPRPAPRGAVEVLIPDCKGDPTPLGLDLRRRAPTC